MAEKKNQHFVPKFHLKKFSQDGASVPTYHLVSGNFVPNASIKGQCSKAYLYGKDQVLENIFERIETKTALVVSEIEKLDRLPEYSSGGHVQLLLFLCTQRGRTQGAGDDMQDATRGVGEHLIPQIAHSIGDPNAAEGLEMVHNAPIIESLDLMTEGLPLIMDLKMVLLKNETSIGFITNDDPVVFYNQFQEEAPSGFLGLQSIGLQIFFPLSPTHFLILYDPGIYRLPRETSTIPLRDPEDVRQLNQLMAVHARNTVYFDTRCTTVGEVKKTAGAIQFKRVKQRKSVKAYEPPSGPNVIGTLGRPLPVWTVKSGADAPRKKVIVLQSTGPKIGLNLTFMKVPKKIRRAREKVASDLLPVRNPALCQLFSTYRELKNSGRLTSKTTFADFIYHQKVMAGLANPRPWERSQP